MKFLKPSSPPLFAARGIATFGIALGLGLFVAGAPAFAQKTEVARVNGVVITEDDLAMALNDIGETIPEMADAERKDYLVTYLTDLMIVSDAARESGLAEDPEFVRRMDYMLKRNLMELYLSKEGKDAANEAAAKKLYEEVIAEVPEEERVRARHILVATEEEAKAVREAIDAGGSFEDLAKEKSTDPGSGANGGDLGWFTKEEMVPEFADAAFALEPGQISDPVKSDFGWHVIRLEEKRNKPGFDEVEVELFEMLARQRQRDIIMSLREGAEIERLYKADDKGGKGKGKKAKNKDDAGMSGDGEGESGDGPALDGAEPKSD